MIKKISNNNFTNKRLLIFDSGVGGLSIYLSANVKFQNIDIHYLSDNEAFPYGNKSINFLTKRVLKVLKHAVDKINPDVLVIGCNTISTILLDQLRNTLTIPIIGVVPAIKTAGLVSETKHVALLATDGTVKRKYTEELINKHSNNCNVFCFGASDLVSNIESFINGAQLNEDLIRSIIVKIQQTSEMIDTVVLGCTHFPLIKEYLVENYRDLNWIDSTDAIISRIEQILSIKNSSELNKTTMWYTQNIDKQYLKIFLKEKSFDEFIKLF